MSFNILSFIQAEGSVIIFLDYFGSSNAIQNRAIFLRHNNILKSFRGYFPIIRINLHSFFLEYIASLK